MATDLLYKQAVHLLQQLISTASYSKYEDGTATIIEDFLAENGVCNHRLLNNVWAVNKHFDTAKPSILLNSHHDTVKPSPHYTNDPFTPIIKDGKLFGLGSNDAGGCLVSLIATFLHFYNKEDLKYNLILAATAEEEISGYGGIELLLGNDKFEETLQGKEPACAIVGEPTKMELAIAEKGLMVLDCVAQGKAGHAAREEGDNAIYKAVKDIEWFSTYQYPKVSEWLGPVKMSVTVINTENKAHNMVPSTCNFVVDIRITELYTHEEVFEVVRQHVLSQVMPRSMRLRSTGINVEHPLVQAGISLGKTCYGSPTSSDKSLMPFPALKCGPGDSARSHTSDEFIFLNEIKEGIETYISVLNKVIL
ncbi:M20 family metallo-hydrolase [Segetibacter sp.]|jgi:acetylornithine deacetylase|uniref:M20 family metallo-hydrolase n=1 Tax=Segetibacter sp. TaxID=2231182 RepID=UPI00262C1D4E|nr:M20 family metallo-hydrolase [Segetibacter sp.]MCW3079033.1 acetylornithine deacetylase [Segetibacter sp.]